MKSNLFISKSLIKETIKETVHNKTLYELWLEKGNEGTEEDFLNSLKGKDAEQQIFIGEVIPEEDKVTGTAVWLQTNLNGDPNAFTLNLVRKKL